MNGKRVLHNLCLTRRAWRAVQAMLIVLVLMGGAWPAHVPAQASDVPAAAPSPGQTPLAELLDEQGRLDLASGFRGSIDARGWQLVSGPDEAPAFAPLAAEESGQWSGIFHVPGINGGVGALAMDGVGNLYAGGEFTSAGGVSVNNIAKWDGSAWSALGSGIDGTVHALATDAAGNLYAGGGFWHGGVFSPPAKWDGSTWSALGSGMNGSVYALALDGSGNLYAGGDFTVAGSVAAKYVAKWDGSAWSALGSGMGGTEYPHVSALVVDGVGNLYAGGEFTTAGGVVASHVAKWNGSTWSALGSGVDSYVADLAVDGTGNLYAGGHFTSAGGVVVNRIAKWNGNTWSALGDGIIDYFPNALAVDGAGNLYAGGGGGPPDGWAASYIAKWDGSAWFPLGGGTNGGIGALAVDDEDNLFAGGGFTTAGGVVVSNIAEWDGNAWSPLSVGHGMNGGVYALAMDGADNLYAGGDFTTAGGVVANNIARWDGGAWSALSTGTNGSVYALAVDNAGNLYAGGAFSHAGSVAANNVARWNGSTWAALGGGVDNIVFALAVNDASNLFAGGWFHTAGGIKVDHIAKWDGNVWSALGDGIDGWSDPVVEALTVDDAGNLYVGGWFSTAGDVAANNIAEWDGSTWAAVGSGMDGKVEALVVDGAGNLYAGGTGGPPDATYIAKWDGSAWSTLGSGMRGTGSPQVYALLVDSAGNLYAGGWFIFAGSVLANHIAKWDGTTWSGLDSGMDGYYHRVRALAIDSVGDLYVGGGFPFAGGKPSANIGAWEKPENKLTVAKTGNGSGRTISIPSGIDCGIDCRERYAVGTVVTLTATADAVSTFSGWGGACTGTGQCVVTMNSAKTVTATFTLQTYPLTVSKADNGSGTVTSNPPGIDCGSACTTQFTAGTVVTLTVTAGAFSNLSGWSGACQTMGPCTVTMNAAKAVTATFTLQIFPLTVNKAGIGSGTVASNPAGITCGTTCGATFSAGTVVTLTATAGALSTFGGWSGACAGAGPCIVTMNTTKVVTATFTAPGAVTPQASTMYYGQQLQVGGEVAAAAPVTVTELVVFTGTVPAGIFLVGVEGSEPYAGEVSAGRLINRLLAEGCGAHGACTAVNVAVYAPDGTHTDFVVASPVITDHLYLPHVSRK